MNFPSKLRPSTLALDPASIFSVGVAQAVITPPVGTALAGFFELRIGTYTRDDLYAKAMVIRGESTQVAIVSLDIICVDAEFVDAAKALIAEECGIAPEQVLICATHTHFGPEVRSVGNKVPRNEEWVAALPRRIADVVREADEKAAPCTLRAGSADVEGYVFNRLYRLKDGKEQMGKWGAESTLLGPAGGTDPNLQTLSAVDENGKLIGVITNLGMHPVTVGGSTADFFSEDWPGAMAKNLSAIYGPEMVTLFLQGACGDTNYQPYDATHLPVNGPDKTEQLGRGLAGAAMLALERAEPITQSTLSARIEEIEVPYYTRTPEIYAQLQTTQRKTERSAMDEFFIRAVQEWPFDDQTCRVPLQAMRIGPVALAAIPAQIFTPVGLEIKQWCPAEMTMVVELANARVTSYIPTADQVERGAYGSNPIISRWLSADAGRRIGDAFLVLFQELWEAPPEN
jgi:hypothetical protein